MPFRDDLNELWEDAIRNTVASLSLNAVRADETYGVGPIMKDIWTQIVRSRILIADLTGKKSNVFYELGLAHALERDVVLLSQSMDDVPFDLRHLRVIVYQSTGRGLEVLKQTLRRTLSELTGLS